MSRMTLEQLRIFIAVAERQHVTSAALALGMSQSAASAAIAALENHYDIKLFHRIGRGIALTEGGERFLVDARAVLARAADAEAALSELGSLKRGHLRIHASQTVAGYWLPRHLMDFRNTFPGISLTLNVGNTAQVAGAVESGAADLGFVEGTVDGQLLEVEMVGRDSMLVVVGADHPWAGRGAISPADLRESAWVLREQGSGTRALFEAALQNSGISTAELNIVLELPSNEAVRAAVETGDAASALSASVVAAGLEAGLLSAVKFALPERALSGITHRQRKSRAAEAFLAIARGGRPLHPSARK